MSKLEPVIDLASIIDQLPGSVYWKDLQGQIIGCNLAQAQALGFSSPKDVIGKTDFDFLSPVKQKKLSN